MSGDNDATMIVRPTPGGSGQAAPQPQMPATPAPVDPATVFQESGSNPLVALAMPILSFASILKGLTQHDDIQGLRVQVASQIDRFASEASRQGIERNQLGGAHYALCATIDDLILNTPWGSRGNWSQASMVSHFHRDTWGGERFFELVQNAQRDPARNLDLLELLYVCLALGFEGQYRVVDRGSAQLDGIRENVYRLIRQYRGPLERELSPMWQGSNVGYQPVRTKIPLWVVASAVVGLLTLAFFVFSLLLTGKTDALAVRVDTLPPTGSVQMPARVPPEPVVDITQYERWRGFLATEIAEGLVEVTEDPNYIRVRLINRQDVGLFASGSDRIQGIYLNLIARIGQELENEPGAVIVAGHTDSDPIRTLRFPSNWHLSLARAQAVQELLIQHLSDPTRISADGQSDTQAIATNDTREGRRKNRRVEILLERTLNFQQ